MISFAGTCTEVDFGANSDLEGGHELPPPSSAGGSFVTAQSSNDDNNSSYLSPLNLLLELSRKGTGTETNPWAIDVEDRAETSFNWRSSALTPWLVNQELLPPSMRIEGIHPGVDLTAQDAPFFDSMSLTSLYSTLTNQSTSRSSGSSNPKRSEDPYDGEDEAEAGENRRNSISNSELFNKMESVERGILHVASMLEALPNKELTESRALTRKLVGLPKRRSPQENALKRKVREHFVAMLGGETALLHQDKRVSISEISAFEVSLKADRANCPPCCSADALRVDLHGQPRSEWNKSVARVSALDYIKSNPASGDNLSNIEKYILTYIKTLHAKVRRLDIQLSYADEEKTKSLERHRCRKANLYQQREIQRSRNVRFEEGFGHRKLTAEGDYFVNGIEDVDYDFLLPETQSSDTPTTTPASLPPASVLPDPAPAIDQQPKTRQCNVYPPAIRKSARLAGMQLPAHATVAQLPNPEQQTDDANVPILEDSDEEDDAVSALNANATAKVPEPLNRFIPQSFLEAFDISRRHLWFPAMEKEIQRWDDRGVVTPVPRPPD
ncbi:hypothetical protein M413DRAFT_26101 [Hebeloma cylindrosporum]|uniref:Uncharacterized protein n=1 Tax=Hebeloma cylindrosporum TaxID=76867 RepID=A0A0C3CJ97_HEBCY|nr:hypothetical protein M413DRAFT_26101 [Hebeloma cylindrosporum h7]